MGESAVLDSFMPIIAAHNERVRQRFEHRGEEPIMAMGPGDDCAVLAPVLRADGSAASWVSTIDTLTANQDFMSPWLLKMDNYSLGSGGYDIGYKTATQNLADIAAMGAVPAALLVSLSLPAETPYEWVEDFARGITEGCVENGALECTIAGGDFGASTEISVTVTAFGITDSSAPAGVRRSGARVLNDDSAELEDNGHALAILALAGRTGWADTGLRLLLQDGSIARPSQQTLEAIAAQLRPTSPLDAGVQAAHAGALAMMDLSDGLRKDAGRMARASSVACVIDEAQLMRRAPELYPALEQLLALRGNAVNDKSLYAAALRALLGGGEDHGLLAIFPADTQLPEGFESIGRVYPARVYEPGVYLQHAQGDSAEIERLEGESWESLGWEHYGA
ncbi:MAG: thiamine-phosphate kinase [Rothia sp. (in: high G+C Gram-positive bacteria)]|uniref:thiamine-phosphate kinase n=1 Tax=Rothia sp. (in: high G+C Gram-positive bacteria) TaxID=1885016 RepID=UPI0026DEEAD3|nr:thiamine-phosphate kinase [Rothia sp. (in: high G+C Gram-positive bacteria)]MDO5750957.1 thiamine-phosphate kinase [Rothia sp. (in: high G+C Gram-positive bacteria)]